MAEPVPTSTEDAIAYAEREAVAVFDSEAALTAAGYELMNAGVTQADLSVLADAGRVTPLQPAANSGDSDGTRRAAYVTPDSRSEATAAITSVPALLMGLGAAAITGVIGAALIPVMAITVGSAASGGSLGFLLSRAFGRKHAGFIERQIKSGGLLLWVHVPDEANDAKILEILTRHGARDVHIHTTHRSWGVADIPLHDFNPDPLLRD